MNQHSAGSVEPGHPSVTAIGRGGAGRGVFRRLVSIIGQRLVLAVASLFVVSVIIFGSVTLLPGNYATAVLGQSATPETVAAFERELGLDRPPVERYVTWISGAVRGDFGASFTSRGDNKRYVSTIVAPRLYNTLFLAGIVALVAVPLSIFLGILCAYYRNGWIDRILNSATLTAISVPEFFVAYILTYIVIMRDNFAMTALAQVLPSWLSGSIGSALSALPAFPILADVSPSMALADRLWMCTLPALTLALVTIAYMMRMTRAAIMNLLATPYVEMAYLKGVSPFSVIVRHALPNAWGPIAYVVTVNLAYLITGVVVVEVVFVYPGAGQLLVDAVRSRDIPVVQACTLIFASAYILLNLITDIVTIVTNPRLLHAR
ncbi:ABC transporter permease [Rhizobium sp. BK068]|uniref:ABC transporter permease n=1 Tax=Rhizobium sp. BK068 TaxID=2512130 RepID=UPI001042DB43|nr:ABC transporter permease [Rhizobium sp. BK068]TCM65751.1 peptide/nickel transport system permease protein [Rhizobium sp. BK068]